MLVEGTAQQMFNNVHAANKNATYPQFGVLLTAQFELQQQQQLHEVKLRARKKKTSKKPNNVCRSTAIISNSSLSWPAGRHWSTDSSTAVY